MNESAGITTYTVGVLDPARCQASYAALLTNTAAAGGGVYFPTTNYQELEIALGDVFSQVIARNSVFASVTLPISVNTEDTYLNQVFIGMFRPDGSALPRWGGNLKQYRLGIVGNTLRLVDADGDPAITSANDNGDISACARSYWTPTTQDSYWNPGILNCAQPGVTAASNSPDGFVVEKGGQGFTLRGTDPADRNLMTCADNGASGLDCTDVDPFDTTNGGITAARLGVPDTHRDAVINWGRGANNCTGAADLADPGACTVESVAAGADGRVRPSSHGDVVHSRPRALNFGSEANPKVVVFYGANDGTLRAINGNRGTECDPTDATCTTAIDGVAAGGELWSFLPPEFFGKINRLRENVEPIEFFGFGTGSPKPYGFDGPMTSFVNVDPSTTLIDEALIYATMRRGGRMVYAFDVSDIADDRDSPEIAWRFGCDETDACTSAGASEIGQTWSAPQILRWDDPAAVGSFTPLLIMGGGYDACEDEDPNACDDTATGRAIYVLNARSGALLKTFTTERPVVGDVFVVPDQNGLATYAYAADLGGNVYRISASDGMSPFGSTDPATWQITTIAQLGCDATATCESNRKFFFSPDVVRDGSSFLLFLGSGDREKPLDGYAYAAGVDNYFFMLRDSPLDPDMLADQATANGCFDDVVCVDSLVEIPVSGPASSEEMANPNKRGWRVVMRSNELVVTSAITVFGTVTFSTHTPRTEVCAGDLGTARAYQVNYLTAAPANGTQDRSAEISGGGLPPSPVAGLVKLDDGRVVPFLIGGSASSALEASLPSSAAFPSQPKGRAYWYISNE
jgi:type IV pilus assembly protein PilY1